MPDNAALKVYSLLPNGKCSNCGHKILKDRSAYTVYNTKAIIEYSKTERYILCPQCKNMISYN